jgi:hypothetical protein
LGYPIYLLVVLVARDSYEPALHNKNPSKYYF